MTAARGLPALPAAYDVTVEHRRRAPLEHALTQQIQTWLVDVDDLPRLPGRSGRAVRFDVSDHFGNGPTLRGNVEEYLAEHDVSAPRRILMLCQPKVYGYSFNPLTVFYCLDADGQLGHVIAEVRNTYGERHNYLIDTTAPAPLTVPKAFYVSPFYPVEGHYEMQFPLPGERLGVSVVLHRDDEPPFVATMRGRLDPAAELRDLLRRPASTRRVMAGIRRHGIALYLKGLRPYPRPSHPSQRTEDDQHALHTR